MPEALLIPFCLYCNYFNTFNCEVLTEVEKINLPNLFSTLKHRMLPFCFQYFYIAIVHINMHGIMLHKNFFIQIYIDHTFLHIPAPFVVHSSQLLYPPLSLDSFPITHTYDFTYLYDTQKPHMKGNLQLSFQDWQDDDIQLYPFS